jgi:hypothetical protein
MEIGIRMGNLGQVKNHAAKTLDNQDHLD